MKCYRCNKEIKHISKELYIDNDGLYICGDTHYPEFHIVKDFKDYYNAIQNREEKVNLGIKSRNETN